jgi:hypothetical protein
MAKLNTSDMTLGACARKQASAWIADFGEHTKYGRAALISLTAICTLTRHLGHADCSAEQHLIAADAYNAGMLTVTTAPQKTNMATAGKLWSAGCSSVRGALPPLGYPSGGVGLCCSCAAFLFARDADLRLGAVI